MATKVKTGQQNGQQMRFTPAEISLIRNTFRDNFDLLKLMRKVFLPELDPQAPLGQMIDLWMTVSVKDMSPEDAMVNIIARNTLISHIDQQLLQLQVLSSGTEESEAEEEARLSKDSAK